MDALFQRILVPTDGSRAAKKATRAALDIARLSGGRLFAVHVVAPPVAEAAFTGLGMMGMPVPFDTAAEAGNCEEDRAPRDARAAAKEAGVPIDSAQVVDARAADAIARTAKGCDCDLIVMSSQGYGGLLSALGIGRW